MDDDSAEIEELARLMIERDRFAAIERICSAAEPERAALTFAKLARQLFPSDLSGTVAIAQAGIQFCLCQPVDPSTRELLLQKAKALSFNLGANTWPGWADGVVRTDTHLAAGRDAACLNLRLTRALNAGPLPESKSHWLIGAHWLAAADFPAAKAEFEQAQSLARTAGDAENELLNEGYIALVRVLLDEAGASAALASTLDALRSSPTAKHGTFFAVQLETALGVFRKRRDR